MSRESSKSGGGFDLDQFQKLVELMESHDLREVRLQRGEERWFLRRGPQEVLTAVPAAAPAPAPVAAPPAAGPATPEPASAPAADSDLVDIVSPTVGTFYQSPQPGDPPFVKVGDRVSADTIVCIVEAMKVFNQIPAGVSGTIAKIVARDGEGVDFNAPLFKVKPD